MSILTLFVTSDNASSERRFEKGLSLTALKGKLEPIVGIPSCNQQLALYNGNVFVTSLEGQPEGLMLGAFPVENFMRLHVVNTGPAIRDEFSDLSKVEKYEMPEEDYERRTDSVRAFKMRNKLGRFSDAASSESKESNENIDDTVNSLRIGARFEAEVEGLQRRGAIKFIGQTHFKPGFWVGVEYDEPLGKHNGTLEGQVYFQCRPKHGAFLRPDKLQVGDFPEETICLTDDEMEEM